MTANIFVALVVGALFLFVIVRMFRKSGRPGINESNRFPNDGGSSIPPPGWNSNSTDAAPTGSGNDGFGNIGGGNSPVDSDVSRYGLNDSDNSSHSTEGGGGDFGGGGSDSSWGGGDSGGDSGGGDGGGGSD